MGILDRLFNTTEKKDSSVIACPTDIKELIQHDDYDTYLFECAKKHIKLLRDAINKNINEDPGFETLLRDVFAMCYKAELIWNENAECDYRYDILKDLKNDLVWTELRRMTRFNGLLSASATIAFAQEYQKREKEIEKQSKAKAKEDALREPRFLGVFRKQVNAEVAEVGGQPDFAFVEIESHVKEQENKLMLWGITSSMLPLEPERVMKVAGLLEQYPEFSQFAEKIGRLRESLVNVGKSKLRQKGVRLNGVSVGSNIFQAVPSELALLGDVNSEAIFYERALGEKLILYDYAAKKEGKKGSMVILIDGSGSVRGEKGYMIRGIAVALVQLARIQKRWVSVIVFGSKNEQREYVFNPHEKTIADHLVEMATTFYGGDTMFWEPLELAFTRLNTPSFRQGDLVLVTDYIQGQEGPLSKFTERFAQAKIKHGFRYFSLFLPSTNRVHDLSWHKLADHVIPLDTTFFAGNSTLLKQLISFI